MIYPGIEDPNSGIKVFPNPARASQCREQTRHAIPDSDLRGKVIYGRTGGNADEGFDIAAIEKGIYVIRINSGNKKAFGYFRSGSKNTRQNTLFAGAP